MIKDFKDLNVWQESVDVVKLVYILTKRFPKEEMFGLTSQIRRAAISIPSNIAEGWARQHTKEYIQFLHHSLGSCAELETQIIIAHELKYVSGIEKDKIIEKINYISRMLRKLIKSLNNYKQAY